MTARTSRLATVAVVLMTAAVATSTFAGEVAPQSFRHVIAKAKPAVVCVTASRTPCKVLKDSFVDFINPFPLRSCPGDTLRFVLNIPLVALRPVDRRSIGSGFVISSDGYVVTNSHVVERASKVKVELPNRKVYKAEIVGQDRMADIALLKLDLPDGVELETLPIGDSDAVQQGDWVIAIGCPFALKWSVSVGIVSYVGRSIGATAIDDMIQMEASLDSGNSGGPLLNTKGEVVGINTAALFMAENKGFAVPIKMAGEIIPDLKKHGEPNRGMLGVVTTDITSETVENEDLAVEDGAFVVRVGLWSPADDAGVESGDVILMLDGQKVIESRDLRRLARNAKVGSTVKLKVQRGEKVLTLDVKVGKLKKPFRIF